MNLFLFYLITQKLNELLMCNQKIKREFKLVRYDANLLFFFSI